MNKIVELIRRKPLLFLLITLAYLVSVGLLKWRLRPPIESVMYLTGGLVGIYFLDIAEVFFDLTPSPFRTVLFAVLFAIVSFFVVTSSGSLLATGLVLSLYLTIILWQVGEWRMTGSLNSWYRMVAGPVTVATQRTVLIVFVVIFLAETFLFVR